MNALWVYEMATAFAIPIVYAIYEGINQWRHR